MAMMPAFASSTEVATAREWSWRSSVNPLTVSSF